MIPIEPRILDTVYFMCGILVGILYMGKVKPR